MLLLVKYRFYSHHVYFWLLTLLAFSLPFSSTLGLIYIGLLIVNWCFEGNWRSRWLKVKHHKSLWFFLSIFLLYLLWIPANKHFLESWKDFIMKLPLLILPVLMLTSDPLEARKIRWLLRFFIGGVVLATLVSTAVYYGLTPYKINDVREISIFIPHIHFSLLIIIAILTILHWIKSEGRLIGKHHLLYILIIVWLVFFLFLLKSLSSVVILGVTMFILILILLNTIENQFLKVWLIIVMYAIPFFSAITFINAYNTFYEEKDNLKTLDTYTENGAPYVNNISSMQLENGHRVWIYLNENELAHEWEKRSSIHYEGQDLKKQPLKYTLIRYMTSKGLKKDSAGVWQLNPRDISNIENGMTNYIFQDNWSIYPRIYETIWEIHNYKISGRSNNKSIIQRFEYAKIAMLYIKKSFWLGYGNADVPALFDNYYKSNPQEKAPAELDHLHNQFIRVFLAFGIIGFFLFMLAFVVPPFLEHRWPSYYFLMIFLILFMSFLNEDILEVQAGTTMMAFFYSLFLWGSQKRLL